MVDSPAMKRLITLSILALVACGGGETPSMRQQLSKTPLSVRGWIADIEGASRGDVQTPETEGARLLQTFQATNIWIDGVNFVSGGVAETGAFILLDVPPGNVTISFNAPGAEDAKLVLQDIPGNADVFVPALMLKRGASATLQPEGIRVRIPAPVDKPRDTCRKAIVAGVTVPVYEAPFSAFNDRRDYPERGVRPLAIVK